MNSLFHEKLYCLNKQAQEVAFSLYLRKGMVSSRLAEIIAITSSLKAFIEYGFDKYSPDQPRVPAGNPDGGQWTSGDGGDNAGDNNSIGNNVGEDQVGNSVGPGSAEEQTGGNESGSNRPADNEDTPSPTEAAYHQFDVNGAVNTLNQQADELKRLQIADGQANLYGVHACAQYVRDALNDGGGLNVGTPANGLGNASDYGTPLENAGFQPAASGNVYPPADYTPQSGDVAVIQPTKENLSGHMEMYNGSEWVSDFRQNGFWPGPHYRQETPNFTIYRYPKSSPSENI